MDFCKNSKLPQKLVGFKTDPLVNPVGGLQSLLARGNPACSSPGSDPATANSAALASDDTGASPLFAIVDLMRNLGNPRYTRSLSLR